MFQASMDPDSKQVVMVQDLRCPENHRFVTECPKFANLVHCHLTFFSADEEGEVRSERPSRLPAPAFKMPQPFRAHAHQSADRSGREEPKRSRSLVLRPHHQPDSTPSNSETHQRRKTITKIPGPKKNLRLKNSLFRYALTVLYVREYIFLRKGAILFFPSCTLFIIASSAALQIPRCRRTLGSNPELLRLWHCQSDH
jgi:hypothetical protein